MTRVPTCRGREHVENLPNEQPGLSSRSRVENGVQTQWLNHHAGDAVSIQILLTKDQHNGSKSKNLVDWYKE